VRDWGGAFAVYRGLTEALPYHRLFNAPISEAAIVGSAWATPWPAAARWWS
jgi:2-oxoisovalerate dehydrogenase E1 component